MPYIKYSDGVLSIRQAAALSGVKVDWLYYNLAQNRLPQPTIRRGNRHYYAKEQLAYLRKAINALQGERENANAK